MDKSPYLHRPRFLTRTKLLAFWTLIFLLLLLFLFPKSPPLSPDSTRRVLQGTPLWDNQIRLSARSHSRRVLVTGAAGFVGFHVSLALNRRGDGVVGIDNFNSYYETSLKRSRAAILDRAGVFVVEGDINDSALLLKLFELVKFTHVMHLAAQAGVRYAMKNPSSYVQSNIAGLVSVLEVCKSANPQPAIVWASSSSVYGLNSRVPFSEKDRTDQPASLYAATKKAVKGCLGALDTAEKSTGSGGRKKGKAQLRVFNLGNTSPVTVSELVDNLEKLLNLKAKRMVLPMPRNGDVPFTHANISLAQKELGYKPTTDLKTGALHEGSS
ncbi:hypothetical protein Csa_010733 [Cucumis sativus]|nr:hypothetical protein Csa_010733 [Cucumis sativus]